MTALWKLEPHTRAKHQVLRLYLDGWFPVMAQQALKVQHQRVGPPRLLILDGFAGPGRYVDGEPGSPLIMLDALLSHSGFNRWGGVTFLFLFIEQDEQRVTHLRAEVDALGPLPPNVKVQIEHGAFESTFSTMLDRPALKGVRMSLVPTFAFIDPFGYAHASMSLTGRILDFPRCEVLFFLPLSFVHRFVGREGQEAALTSLFGCDRWKEAIPLRGDARRAFLVNLFEEQLSKRNNVEHARSFQLRTPDGNDYRLVFGLGHIKGLEIAKDAMWKVDPDRGTSYAAQTDSGQEVLFAPLETLDTAPLLHELRRRFETEWFTIDDADRCTLLDTPYAKSHLRRRTLQPAEKDGVIEVERTGPTGFKNARLRFIR